MPVVNQRVASCYIWLISCVLFICIVVGGAFLFLYLFRPEFESPSWYPTAGIILVGLPWLFWFLTCLYRILSRTFGFRMVCWGMNYGGSQDRGASTGVDGFSGSGGDGGSVVNEAARVDSPQNGDSARRVHFGGAVVVNEEEGRASEGNKSSSTSSNSREIEMPLKLSMAS
ncbi:hypothetical protein Nepgr_001663 [Nepenthes gracilis]|uniref:Uncharacterized protein n=1 Tax=Nepenthes gracilis TaxID=150966 RepID=A0AAD3RX63_NEPGR|nr:hypothetical protein Nepgr_001663 [Nepenthes gracilis]